MILVKDVQQLSGQPLTATIGFFDGVHLGHRFLIEALQQEAAVHGEKTAVITFVDSPRAIVHPDFKSTLLQPFEEKIARLATTNIDYCIVLPFDLQMSKLSAEKFIKEILAKQYHVTHLLIGYDHRFGHNREEGFADYVSYGAACDMQVIQAEQYSEKGQTISSSLIRKLLSNGQVEQAATLLTVPYSIRGHIISGFGNGRKLGFPTANILPDETRQLIPGVGVYAVRVMLANNYYKGMLYIGRRPTLDNGEAISMEVHILHFSADIYNQPITVFFLKFVREDIKFNSLEALTAQLEKDRDTVEHFITETSPCTTTLLTY